MRSAAVFRIRRWALSRSFILAALLVGLSGCSWLWQPDAVMPGGAERERLRAVSGWVMEGRIAVRTPEDAWSANLEWRHGASEDRMDLNGPFAQRAATIRYSKNFISFESADGDRAESGDPEALLRERLGFAVPLEALRHWYWPCPRRIRRLLLDVLPGARTSPPISIRPAGPCVTTALCRRGNGRRREKWSSRGVAWC